MPLATTWSRAGGTSPAAIGWVAEPARAGVRRSTVRRCRTDRAASLSHTRPTHRPAHKYRRAGDLVAGKPLRSHVVVGSHRGPGLGQAGIAGGAGDAEIHQIREIVAGDQMFAGLTSRCVTPLACAASKAAAICRTMATARAGVKGPWASTARSEEPRSAACPHRTARRSRRSRGWHHMWLGQPAGDVGLPL